MIEQKIKVPFKKLKYIHHMADIQIRNLYRHKEYSEVFERTYDEIRKYPDNAVIFIAGDIAHSKTQMSPELINMLSDLFRNLADICPTILIAGNHDCNLNNRSRMDCLSPLVNNIQHPNLHYFKNTGVYTVADTKMIVWDVWDNPKDFIRAKKVDGDTKILLYHGTVDKSTTDTGYRLPSKVKLFMMKGFDLALLGDIHKRQFLNLDETVAYPGSLVQQNHGESLGHGYLRWDVPKRESTYVEIHNDYGYYTVDVDGGVLPDLEGVPNKARLRLRVSATDGSEIKKILAEIRRKYGIEEVTVNRTDKLFETIRAGDDTIDIGDVNDTDYQYSLIEDYLKRNYVIDDDLLIDIKDLNEKINEKLPSTDISLNIFWKIKIFEFDNMFAFGEKNIVDFTKLNGIMGLFGPNKTGKSALLDALSFCLFDNTSRTYKAERILNNKSVTFKCKVNFEINGEDYYIERNAKKHKNGNVSCPVKFWKIEDGEKIELSGEQRYDTNSEIRKYIGTYEDFILTAMSIQNDNTTFIDKGQSDRKELLAQFMGLGIFDRLYTVGNEESNEIESVLKNFEESDYDEAIVRIENELEADKDTYSQSVILRGRIKESVSDINTDIMALNKKITKIDPAIIDIDILEIEKLELAGLETECEHGLNIFESTKLSSDVLITQLKDSIRNYDEMEINEQYDQLEQYRTDRNELEDTIGKLRIYIENKLEKTSKLRTLKYDPNCTFCMDNPYTIDALLVKKELDNDKVVARTYVTQLDDTKKLIERLRHIDEDKKLYDESHDELETKLNSREKLIANINLNKVKFDNIKHKIEDVKNKIENYHDNKQDILNNAKIIKEISSLTNTLQTVQDDLDIIDEEIRILHGKIEVSNSQKNAILETLEKVSKLEDKYGAYKYYLESVKRDGIPYELIQKALPVVESAVNEILTQIVEFGIMMEMDGKNVNLMIVYDEENSWPLELASGMEKFIASLAIRVGLVQVCNLPRINGLFIDEGFGNLDAENLAVMHLLFQYLKTQFQYVIIVSHLESMRDAVDNTLEITTDEKFSYINYAW